MGNTTTLWTCKWGGGEVCGHVWRGRSMGNTTTLWTFEGGGGGVRACVEGEVNGQHYHFVDL